MRRRSIILFFSTALAVYGLLNLYVFIHGWEVIKDSSSSLSYVAAFLVLSLSFMAGRLIERVRLSWFTSFLVWIGSIWLAAFVYFLIASIAVDIVRLLNLLVPIVPGCLTGETTLVLVVVLVFTIIVIGYLNAAHPRIRTLDLHVPKRSGDLKTLNIAVASDIHLGTIICKSRLERIVKDINRLDPDLVLLPGDVVDEDIGPVIKQNLGETLLKIKSRFGVYAITGNHEYIGGVEAACKYLSRHGIVMLRDESVKVGDGVYVVGREDRAIGQFAGRKRKPLLELMSEVDRSFPIILMDHQPFRLEEAVDAGVDLQLSGHTHHGQLWPFNFITRRVYELSWGYKKKGSTHIYVSSGVGTWGPPVRTGNFPEIVNVRLTFA